MLPSRFVRVVCVLTWDAAYKLASNHLLLEDYIKNCLIRTLVATLHLTNKIIRSCTWSTEEELLRDIFGNLEPSFQTELYIQISNELVNEIQNKVEERTGGPLTSLIMLCNVLQGPNAFRMSEFINLLHRENMSKDILGIFANISELYLQLFTEYVIKQRSIENLELEEVYQANKSDIVKKFFAITLLPIKYGERSYKEAQDQLTKTIWEEPYLLYILKTLITHYLIIHFGNIFAEPHSEELKLRVGLNSREEYFLSRCFVYSILTDIISSSTIELKNILPMDRYMYILGNNKVGAILYSKPKPLVKVDREKEDVMSSIAEHLTDRIYIWQNIANNDQKRIQNLRKYFQKILYNFFKPLIVPRDTPSIPELQNLQRKNFTNIIDSALPDLLTKTVRFLGESLFRTCRCLGNAFISKPNMRKSLETALIEELPVMWFALSSICAGFIPVPHVKVSTGESDAKNIDDIDVLLLDLDLCSFNLDEQPILKAYFVEVTNSDCELIRVSDEAPRFKVAQRRKMKNRTLDKIEKNGYYRCVIDNTFDALIFSRLEIINSAGSNKSNIAKVSYYTFKRISNDPEVYVAELHDNNSPGSTGRGVLALCDIRDSLSPPRLAYIIKLIGSITTKEKIEKVDLSKFM